MWIEIKKILKTSLCRIPFIWLSVRNETANWGLVYFLCLYQCLKSPFRHCSCFPSAIGARTRLHYVRISEISEDKHDVCFHMLECVNSHTFTFTLSRRFCPKRRTRERTVKLRAKEPGVTINTTLHKKYKKRNRKEKEVQECNCCNCKLSTSRSAS